MLCLHSGPVTSDNEEQSPAQRWSARPTLAAVAVAVAIGGLGGAAIYAATAGAPHTMAGAPRNANGQMHASPPEPGAPKPAGAAVPDDVLHSEYVVADGHGGFTTKMTQTGTVDEVTLSSVVVRSDDGYTQIYEFPSASAANQSVAPNDTITVQATRTGPTVTLNSIRQGPPHAN
jgi:hypothetical protein